MMQQKKQHILYISYDGMTDFLGQSQVIPYLIELQKYGYQFTILSCEKKEKYELQGQYIRNLLQQNNIRWQVLAFSTKPPILAKYYDIFRLKKKALDLHRKYHFDMTHCRSYIAADVGYFLKKKHNIKFLFDMRGFWVDERVDGGLWNLKNPLYNLAYKTYKKKGNQLCQSSRLFNRIEQSRRKRNEKMAEFSANTYSNHTLQH